MQVQPVADGHPEHGRPSSVEVAVSLSHGTTVAAMTTYGRDDTARALARSKAPVVLLTGDSGVGKSVVLQAAQEVAAAEGQIAPPPRTVRHSGGILQVALLQALGDAVALSVERNGRASEVAHLLVEAAKRLARDRGQELAKVVGKELLSVVRGRLGPDAGKAFEEYAKHLKSAADESLAARLTAAVDPGVAALIVDFAGDVCDVVRDGYVMLALDGGERLRDEDLRLLADLQETLPSRLRVRVAFSTNTTANAVTVRSRTASGARASSPSMSTGSGGFMSSAVGFFQKSFSGKTNEEGRANARQTRCSRWGTRRTVSGWPRLPNLSARRRRCSSATRNSRLQLCYLLTNWLSPPLSRNSSTRKVRARLTATYCCATQREPLAQAETWSSP